MNFFISTIIPIVIAIFASYLYFVPCGLDPVVWDKPCKLFPLVENTILDNGIKLHENKIQAPESFAFDEHTGLVYSGLADGQVVQFSETGQTMDTIMFIGGYMAAYNNKISNSQDIDLSLYSGMKETKLFYKCQSLLKANKLSSDEQAEKICGRPLGMRIVYRYEKAFLYVADAYHGIFKIELGLDSALHQITHLVTTRHLVDVPVEADSVAGLPVRFFNDIEVMADDKVLFSDSSYKFTRAKNRYEVVDGTPRGRLLQYSPETDQVRTLLCGLHFPNGIQFLPPKDTTTSSGLWHHHNKEELLVAELTRFRVLKVNVTQLAQEESMKYFLSSCSESSNKINQYLLTAPTSNPSYAPSISIFIDSLQGVPDNIRLNRYRVRTKRSPGEIVQYVLIGSASKSAKPFSFLWFLFQSNIARYTIAKILPVKLWDIFIPKYGMVIAVDLEGKVLGTFQSPKGEVAWISEAQRHPHTGDLWIGSHASPYLAIVPSKHIPKFSRL